MKIKIIVEIIKFNDEDEKKDNVLQVVSESTGRRTLRSAIGPVLSSTALACGPTSFGRHGGRRPGRRPRRRRIRRLAGELAGEHSTCRPTQWTLDQAARLRPSRRPSDTVLEHTGAVTPSRRSIHCQGSTSFMMAAWPGLLPEVTTIVSQRGLAAPGRPAAGPVEDRVLPPAGQGADPLPRPALGSGSAGRSSPTAVLRLRPGSPTTSATTSCAAWRASPTESGKPDAVVPRPPERRHPRLAEERSSEPVPLTFFDQMSRCVRMRGIWWRLNGLRGSCRPALPARAPRTDARDRAAWRGERNRCFSAESQERTFDLLQRLRPGALRPCTSFPDYGHLDMFMGKDAARDVFPTIRRQHCGRTEARRPDYGRIPRRIDD